MSARLRTYVSIAAVVAATISGCSSDGDGAEATLPSIATTTSGVVTIAPTTSATPPTPAAPTTVAPSSTTSTTSTVAETTTTVAPSTTVVVRGAALVLRDTGIGDAAFGADPDEVVSYVTSILGGPTADTGWADPYSSFGICPGTAVRGVTWNDLTLLFSDSSTVAKDRRHFFTYSYGKAFIAGSPDPNGPKTSTGIGIGSTVAALRAAFPQVIVNPSDDIYDATFYVDDSFTGFLSGSTDADTVTAFTGGIGCGE